MKLSIHKIFFLFLFVFFALPRNIIRIALCVVLCAGFRFSLISQNFPWNAKFIISYENGFNDTVWFGCDTVATDGYDAGLDVIDTVSFHPLSILSHENSIQQSIGSNHCGNLKKNIKPFKKGKVTFTFYPLSDTVALCDPNFFWNNTCMAKLNWDTTDFIFQNDSFKIIGSYIKTYYGYINAIDLFEYYIGYEGTFYLRENYAYLLPESTWFPECNYSGYNIDSFLLMKIDLEVYFNVLIDEVRKIESFVRFNFINPNNGFFNINFNETFNGNIQILNSIGQIIIYKKVRNSIYEQINLTAQPQGIYFLHVYNETHNQTFKIIKH